MIAEITTAEFLSSLQSAVFASLGIVAVFGSIWAAVGKNAYKSIKGWFERLDHRLDAIDSNQGAAQVEREGDRRAAERRDAAMTGKMEAMTSKLDNLVATVQDHHAVLYGAGARAGLIEEVAYFRGREDQRRSTAP